MISEPINVALRAIDPDQHYALQALNTHLKRDCAYMEALDQVDPLLLLGRVILFNRKTPVHRDGRDPPTGWAVIVAAGQFNGGALHIPALKLRLRLEPGDAVMLKGHVLEHEVDDWDNGQRISFAHFTHQSVWDFCNMHCP